MKEFTKDVLRELKKYFKKHRNVEKRIPRKNCLFFEVLCSKLRKRNNAHRRLQIYSIFKMYKKEIFSEKKESNPIILTKVYNSSFKFEIIEYFLN